MGNLFGFQGLLGRTFLKKIISHQLIYLSTFFFSVSSVETKAQVIKWDFDSGSGTDMPLVTTPNVATSALSLGNNNGSTTLITTTSSSTGYTSSSGYYNAQAAAVPDIFNQLTSSYFEFTLTPAQGYSVAVTAVNFGSRSTGTGPQAYSIRSSIDSYNSDIVAKSLPADSKWYLYQNTSLAVSSTSPITFRIYGYNGSGSSMNVAVWRIDDLNLDVTVSSVQTYYRSRQSGYWSTPSTWEYSTDNTNWNISSKVPSKDAESILIQPGHTVNVATPVSLDQTTVAGILELQTGGVLNINDGAGEDIIIPSNGVLKITSTSDYATSVQQSVTANINIASSGKIAIGDGTSSTGNSYEAFATSSTNVWNDGAVFEYNNNGVFQIAALTYFPNASSTITPVFSVIKVNGNAAAGSGKDFYLNGLLKISTDVAFSGAGKKYFRNGIKGTATLTQLNAGKFYLNNPNAVLDGASLNLVLSYPIDLGSNTTVPAGAFVTISGSNMSNTSGNLTVNGTLDMTTSTISNSSGGVIIINGTYRTANSGGFSGTNSSIPTATGTSLNAGSTIELYANGDQLLNARTDFKNLIFSGNGTKKPTGSFSPAGTVTIKDNAVFDCSGRNIGDETESGPTATNLTMSGNSRLIVDTYGPNPKMAGTYNLSGGVIEFKGSNGTAETIRSKNYQNIEVTGTNVGMSDGNIILNNNGTFTVKSGGVFTINDNTINGTTGGIQTVTVKSGGYFKCGTNMGFNGATITSIPIKSSAINADIENIILEANSTVDYSRTGDQPITNAGGLIYQNLMISGSGNKTAPSDNLTIQGNLSKTSSVSFIHNNGTVTLNGSSEQTYSCISPQMVFNNLTNENTVGLNVDDSLSVYNKFSLEDNSVINLKADITLLSSKDQTAGIGRLGANVNINYNAGRFIVERYINTNTKDGGHQKSWQLISTTAFGETIFNTWQEKGSKTISGYGTWITDNSGTANGFDAFSIAPSMKNYDAGSNSWAGISGTDIMLENEKGYMIFVRGDRLANNVNSAATPTILRTRGKLYSPQFPPPTSAVPAGKFQSVGNPYASVIDFSKIASSNIQSSYIAWDPTLGGAYGLGGYQTISAATGYTAVPGNTGNYNSSDDYRYIQSGQAFFVFNYTTSEGSVTFSEDCKTSGNYHMVNRQSENDNGILFANLATKNGTILDGNAVSFSSNFSNKIDGDDALKISAPAENFAVRRAGKILTVEARQEINPTDTVFYTFKNLTRQDYKIIFVPRQLHSQLDGYLVDQFLKTQTQISFTDTSFFNFTVTDDKASSNPDRFYLVFRAVAAPLGLSLISMNAFSENGNVSIEWKVENEHDVKNYEVEYSTDGTHFSNIGVVSNGNPAGQYYFLHQKPGTGIAYYRIKINKINGESEYKKVVRVFIPDFIQCIHVYPNPIRQGVINLQFVKQPLGNYCFNLYNILGQSELSEVVNYKGEDLLSLKTLKNLSVGIYELEIIKPNGERATLKIKSL
ncbi:MAG: hypothetical protein KGM16_20695 [Bacteroidota bacterium]|nr:hypothetical protein [Bacteroidota bacterium]